MPAGPFRTKRGKLVNAPIKKVSPKGVVHLAPQSLPSTRSRRGQRAKIVIENSLIAQIRKKHPTWTKLKIFSELEKLMNQGSREYS